MNGQNHYNLYSFGSLFMEKFMIIKAPNYFPKYVVQLKRFYQFSECGDNNKNKCIKSHLSAVLCISPYLGSC